MPVAWNLANAKHLLSRSLFGYTRKDLEAALSFRSAEDFIDRQLLADVATPVAPGPWITETPIANNGVVDATRYTAMTYWWYDQMLSQKTSMREKMVLFWHNHFVSARDKVGFPQHLYNQNTLFRKFAWGNVKDLTNAITTDPAMLIYLDGNNSFRTTPNENYARELMELFTIGIGNYTENDVKQSAMAHTGWVVRGLTAVFDANRWANQPKTFMGQTGNFKHTDITDIIFSKEATSEFICRKLYTEFVYYKPNEAFVKQMAKILRDNKFEIKPVLRFMLASDEFYNDQYRGAKIKSPMELTLSALKTFDQIKLVDADWSYLFDATRALQQQVFYPPSVRGWVGQRDWISTTTFAQRGGFTDAIVNGKRPNGQVLTLKINALNYARSYSTAEDAAKLVDDIVTTFVLFPVTRPKRAFLVETLLDGTIASNWSTSTPMADLRIQKLLRAVMRMPEFQMG